MVAKQFSIRNIRITEKLLKDIAFILFFCRPLITRCFRFVLVRVGMSSFAIYPTLILIYLPVVILLLFYPKSIKLDFFLVLLGVSMFALVTYLFHPEYHFVYTRDFYGVVDYVLRPDNGLYAYFFIRLMDDPKDILKNMKISAWFMYPYYAYLLYLAKQAGYWVDEGAHGQTIHMAYSLSFGYDLLLFCLVFLFFALSEKKPIDLIMAIAGFVMIILGGSRGPLMCIAIFLIIYIILWVKNSKYKVMCIVGLVTVSLAFLLFYESIMTSIIQLLESMNIESRTIRMILEGNISDDNGREPLWNAAIQMIKENPFGWGMMGTRHVVYYLHVVGHPHQFFLEVLVDFGVIAGSVIIIMLLTSSYRIFSMPNKHWNAVFLIFFSRACHLLISGTYWHLLPFWACIAIGVSALSERKRLGGRKN